MMTTSSWVAALDKKEHQNWVMVGCALNITKNGIAPLIQKKMEAWYQSLISSPPLQSLPPCACVAGSPKCGTCVTWETEMKRHHKSGKPKIFWDNSDRNQWGSPTGAWEVAKIFMPTLGTRTTHVIDAETTDIGGLLNLLEWCPFIHPPVSRTVLTSARDQCRNHWAHAPKQELPDADVNTIFGHLNSLLNDPVFSSDKDAQKSSTDLQDLFHHGLVNVRDSEVGALNLLRQSLVAELSKCRDELDDVQVKVAQLDKETKRVGEVQKDLLEVKEQGDLDREETIKLREQVKTEVHTAREELGRCQEDLIQVEDKVAQLDVEMKRIHESAKEDGNLSRAEIAKLKQQLQTEVKEVEADLNEKVSTILNTVEDINILLSERDDLREVCDLISEDVEYLKRKVDIELATTKSQLSTLEIDLSNMNYQVQGVANEVATNKTTISGLQKDVLEVKEEVETLKATPVHGLNSVDVNDVLFTTPSRLTAFTGRDSALAWLEQNLTPHHSGENCPGRSCCTKTICGLGGCGKTSLAVEFAWKCKNRFPGGVFWINGESDENINKSVVENLALLNISASTSEKVDDTLNRFSAFLSKKKHPWLLVVDNADELEDKTCPTGVKKICKGPWQRNGSVFKHGHILLTTRQTVKETKTFLKLSPDDCLELKCFSEEEGALFLMRRTGNNGKALHQEAIDLVNELGALPLALEQAAAYISALPIPCSFKMYLEKYRAVKISLLEQQPATAQTTEAQYRLSVHTTWLMNFELVRNESPAAATMMHIAAFLESEKVPIDVINPGLPELEQVELRESARSEIDIAAILKVLSCYSLFSVDQQSRVFGVHKLVQEVVRESLTASARIETMVAATRVLHFALKTTNNAERCNSKLANPWYLLNLSSMRDQARNVLIALLLNFRKLKNHMEEEMKLSKEDSVQAFLDEHTLSLCAFACDLSRNNLSLLLLHAELSEFNMKVTRTVRGDIDPNLVLERMVFASIAKRNVSSPGSYVESKTLAEETVQKMSNFESSGCTISNETKFLVHKHRASYYAREGEWKKNYEALLKLEGLEVSKAATVELQTLIARAERFVSACNFQAALDRYQRALQLAREIYPYDHPGLLMVLQHIATFLHGLGKKQEAKPYAEEMMAIAEKQPLDSDDYITGMTDALSVLSAFDAPKSEKRLLAILNERWPRIYKCVMDGCMEPSSVVIEDGSDDNVAKVLESLLHCYTVIITSPFDSKFAKRKFAKEKGKPFLRIAQTLLSIRTKFYGEKHPGLKQSYIHLINTHYFLGNKEQVEKFFKLMNQCELPEASTKFSQGIDGDYNVAKAGMLKDDANKAYSSGNYSNALALYTQMLNLSPNDPKLLTNRASTYMKLSQQPGQNSSQNISLALQDSRDAITADPSWVKGYYWKAACLAHLGERGPSLAAAAVAQHLFPSQCAKIPAVEDRFGGCNVEVVRTVQELLQATERRDTRNLVIVIKEGRYELPNPVKLQENTVLVGLGKTQIICARGIPLKVNKTVYVENITLSPSIESVSMLKEKAKGCLNRGQVDEALSLYSEALNSCPNDPQILTSRALTYLKSAEQKKDIPSERRSSLELALKDAEAAIKADSSWLLGYHTKAVSLAKLDRKQQALAAAAVFKHLSSDRDVPEITRRYGSLQIHVVESSDQLCSVLQQMKNPDGVNQVVLVKEGEYLLERTVEIPRAIGIAGLGKVKISCQIGVPFHFAQAGYVESVEMFEDCGSQQESHVRILNEAAEQSEVISLAAPAGYEHINSECKVN